MLLITCDVEDEEGTRRFAEDIAMILKEGDMLALSGGLGAGKSSFARALIRVLLDDPSLEVPSPTFTLVQTYEGPRFTIAHCDLYRLDDPEALQEMGFDDLARGGVVVVEWPERAGAYLDDAALILRISDGPTPTARRFMLSGPASSWKTRLERTLHIRSMLERAGYRNASRRQLAGDASHRRYERVDAEVPAVVMDWPPRPQSAALRDGLPYGALVHVQDDPLSFIALAHLLRDKGFNTPRIDAADRQQGLLVMEDLGAVGLIEDGKPVPARWRKAACILAEKDATSFPSSVMVSGEGEWSIPSFDRRALHVELSLCPDWYILLQRDEPLEAQERETFFLLWEPLLDRILSLPQGLVLRDVIAANLLWREKEEGRRKIAFLDFQDAMHGPLFYDFTALVTDVRIVLPPTLRAAMFEDYHRVLQQHGKIFSQEFVAAGIALLSAQRNTKILGGFVRLALRDGKRSYLEHLPRVRQALAHALEHPLLSTLQPWYERYHLV